MNRFDILRAQKRAVEQAEVRSALATSTLSEKLAALPSATLEEKPRTLSGKEKMQALIRMAGTPLGMGESAYGDEVSRITDMEVITPMTPDEIQAYQHENVLAETLATGWKLHNLQCEAGAAYERFHGLFAQVGVGWGKTLITLMCAYKAYTKGLKKILLHVPANVRPQLVGVDIKVARTRIPFNMPVHDLGGRNITERRMLATSNKKGLYIMPYSLLSAQDAEFILETIRPELIIVDEAHNLSSRGSARTKRLLAYVDRHKPEGIALSGTITKKTVRDYFHLIKWCLKEYNPLPNGLHLADEWGAVIDSGASGVYGEGDSGAARGATGPLMPLIRWGQRSFPQQQFPSTIAGFRKAFKLRKDTAPGVISSDDASISTSLVIQNCPVENREKAPGWKELTDLTKKIEDEWTTPNGDEIEHAIHMWKWLNEMWGAGFYNQLVWPSTEKYADRKKISKGEAEDILAKCRLHHEAGQVYAKELRIWLGKESFPGCDTPFLVGREMAKNKAANVSNILYEKWLDWKRLDFEGRPDRDSHAVRVCSFKIDAAVAWAEEIQGSKDAKGGIIWVHHQEAGVWCYEGLVKAGVQAIHCPAGDRFNQMIIDHQYKHHIVVASITAHGTGKNLQHFQNNYFLQWPRDASAAEQVLGRTHRVGQLADELVMNTNMTVEFDQLNFAACLNDSLYIHQTTQRQKLIYSVYNPLPKIFPTAVLVERGLEPTKLSSDMEKMLQERFGA